MPVSKGRGIFSANVDKKNPHLAAFAHEINSVMEHWGYIANVQMFDSGYVGIKIEFTNDQGKPTKWLVVDQPGKVGMEDQSMGYIFFGPSGPIQKSNAWVWEQVPYHGRKFGDVNFRDTDREFAYSAILDAIEEKLASPIKENKMKITKGQLRQILKEYGYGNGAPPRDSNWRSFADALDIGVLDLDAMAYDLGFMDFRDMDISISPRSLAKRDPASFIAAAQASSMRAQDMSPNEILAAAAVVSGLA